ncbi:MAG: glycerol-3-phosphate 1-O-acyltransferase PlsY [Nitrospira sp.]|nr:glycerol-3-phosphate 1-O-acyltransferase PlsY [Nitrospira sp.]MDH4246058.1 glycerol-3-phosphate 1-O-acyltransferase PlsY [Nitrospira sp.]MDH4356049.1 glycerol-3-phosphate 1-O-acyltransferase PlsY [Nitrospira sp.]MDH5319109.1 glycerol-3-phosphate 1-O-acyltransferase PlsY [Nitrospira sp.]
MDQQVLIVGLTIVGYLLGAVPFGVVISKAMGFPDPRTVGSKNVGFTNVLRVSGKKPGILTLIGDMGKGWVMGYAATQLLQDEWAILLVALAPFLGHLFSPFLGFKGGKGVATALGSVLGVAPLIGLILLLAWLGAVALWRYSSGGALTAFGLFPVIAALLRPSAAFVSFALVVTGLILVKHKGNIERLRKGTESKMGERKN